MWSLPKHINKSILDSSSISLSSYFIFKSPFLFYKLLFPALICEQHTASRSLLSFALNGKWGITLPHPKILAYACAGWLWSKIAQSYCPVKEIYRSHSFFFFFFWGKLCCAWKDVWSVQRVVVQLSLSKLAQTNSESNAMEVDNVLLPQHVVLGSMLLNRAVILLVPKWQALGSVMCFIEASIFCLEHTPRSQSTSFFFQWRHAKMLKILFAATGL